MDWTDRLNRDPQLITLGGGELELLSWNYAPHLPDNKPHRHTHFEVCQVGVYGRGSFMVAGHTHTLEPGDLFIARPGVVHQILNTAQPDMELYWASFNWLPGRPHGELGTLLRSFADSSTLVVPDEERVAALWRALNVTAQGDGRVGLREQLTGLTTTLLLAIVQAGSGGAAGLREEPTDPGAAKVRLALRYIHDNVDRRLSVAEVAAQLNLSPRHLARLFAQHLGTSPAEYAERVRLEQARMLLQTSTTPIKEVASDAGYASVHAFSRAFTRRFSCPPGAFRRAGGGVSQTVKKLADPAKDSLPHRC